MLLNTAKHAVLLAIVLLVCYRGC